MAGAEHADRARLHAVAVLRFGANIADVATRILRHSDASARVRGVALEPGSVLQEVTQHDAQTSAATRASAGSASARVCVLWCCCWRVMGCSSAGGALAVVVITHTNKGLVSELLVAANSWGDGRSGASWTASARCSST